MNAPLSRFLIEFSREIVEAPFDACEAMMIEADETIVEAVVSLSQTAFEETVAAARAAGATEARAEVEQALKTAFEEERSTMVRAFEEEREAWAQREGQAISESLTTAVAALEDDLSTALAAALRPLFSQACQARVLAELRLALDAILGDPSRPVVRIEGPLDLLTAFGDAHASEISIDYVVSDRAEITIITDTTRITTRLSECLAGFQLDEGR